MPALHLPILLGKASMGPILVPLVLGILAVWMIIKAVRTGQVHYKGSIHTLKDSAFTYGMVFIGLSMFAILCLVAFIVAVSMV